MEEFCSVDIKARQKYFPWLKIFLEKLLKTFPNYSVEDVLPYLLENVGNEMEALSLEPSKKRQKALFETVSSLFLHFWWRMHWKGKNMWKKYWKKDDLDSFNCDGHAKYYAKLLYYVIHLGLILSKGVPDSPWINRILQVVKILPDCDDIVYSSLLMIRKIKKFRDSYTAILRHILLTGVVKCITEPIVYIKIMILFKKLKLCIDDNDETIDLVSAASKFQTPSNLLPWLSSLNLGIKDLKQKNFIRLLLSEGSSEVLFAKLQMIVTDFECMLETKPGNLNIQHKKNLFKIKNSQVNRKKKNKRKQQKSQSNTKIKGNTACGKNKLSRRERKNQTKSLKEKTIKTQICEGYSWLSNTNQHNPCGSLKFQNSSMQSDTPSFKNNFITENIEKSSQAFTLSDDNYAIIENGIGVKDISRETTCCSNNGLLGKRCKSFEGQNKKFKLVHNVTSLKDAQNLSEISSKATPIELNKMHSSHKPLITYEKNNVGNNDKNNAGSNNKSDIENSSFMESLCFDNSNNSLLSKATNAVNSFQSTCNNLMESPSNSNLPIFPNSKTTSYPEERNAIICGKKSQHDLNRTPSVSLIDIRNVYPPNVCNSLLQTKSLNTSLSSQNSVTLNKDINKPNIVDVGHIGCNSDLPLVKTLTPQLLGKSNTNYKDQIKPKENTVDLCNKNHCIQNSMSINSNSEINTQSINQQCNDLNSVLDLSIHASQPLLIDQSNSNKCAGNQVLPLSPVMSDNCTFSKTPVLNETQDNPKNSGTISRNEYALLNEENELHGNINTNLDAQNTYSYVIDCKIANESNDTAHSGPRSRNSDISSIKVIINLNNKKPDVSVHSQNDHIFGSIESHSKVVVSSTSDNIFSGDPNSSKKLSLPFRSSSPNISLPINISDQPHDTNVLQKETIVFQSEKETFSYPKGNDNTSNLEQNKSNPSEEYIQISPNSSDCFLSPPKHISNVLTKNNSVVESDFRTPHTSDCDSEFAFENISFFSSFEANFPIENGVSQSNLPEKNSNIEVIQNHQNHFNNISSISNFSCNLAETELLKNDSSSKHALYRNSKSDLYSEVSEDDVSISTLGVISEEDTDHNLMKSTDYDTSPEGNTKFATSTPMSDSRDCKNNTASTKNEMKVNRKIHQNKKKLCSSNVNCAHNDTSKKLSTAKHSASKCVNRMKTGKSSKTTSVEINSENRSYNLRSRRKIVQPSKFIDYIV